MNPIETKNLRLTPSNKGYIYIETYGCQMNVADSEVVLAIMQDEGYIHTEDIKKADIILINTCAIRDNAEQRVWNRLRHIIPMKRTRPSILVGIIGCMAKRLEEQLMEREQMVDLVVGPDAYRSLPQLVRTAESGGKAINILLSREETYAEIAPVRTDKNGVAAFISIMRGCNNMCSYCVVPYTRGAERSRSSETIISEAKDLFSRGYKEVTLLGQNVNSYSDKEIDFPTLLRQVAEISPELRVRFATSHPKDISEKLIETIAQIPNICKAIHLPAQSGSSRILELMNRKYSREWYLERIAAIRQAIPDCAITTDIIAGFSGETEDDHQKTLSLMQEVGYDFAYMYIYSERPNTKAERTMSDDVSEETKTRRLTEIIKLQNKLSLRQNQADVGKLFEVLIEGRSKRSESRLSGRTSQNKVVIFDAQDSKMGDYVTVKITDCSSATLLGEQVSSASINIAQSKMF